MPTPPPPPPPPPPLKISTFWRQIRLEKNFGVRHQKWIPEVRINSGRQVLEFLRRRGGGSVTKNFFRVCHQKKCICENSTKLGRQGLEFLRREVKTSETPPPPPKSAGSSDLKMQSQLSGLPLNTISL